MPKKRKLRRQLAADVVLSGRVDASGHQLLDLIHRVNPTGLPLSGAAIQHRYAQKNALQSLLIRRFKEQVRIVADPSKKGLITVYFQGRDACHAQLSELEPEARSWAQHYLDQLAFCQRKAKAKTATKQPTSGRSRSQEKNRSVDELIAAAQAAILKHHYETAGELFMTAIAQGGGAMVAEHYLELLVETLADYETALSLAQQFTCQFPLTPSLKARLAIAAAQTAQQDLALYYLKRLSGAKAAESYRILCAQALGRKDLKKALIFFDNARRFYPVASQELNALKAKISALRHSLG